MPLMGFGCGSPHVETYLEAFRAGYRHFDTAFSHFNHAVVGEAIRRSGLPREEVFLTTKVGFLPASRRCCWGLLELPGCLSDPPADHPLAGGGDYVKGRELPGIRRALAELGLDYIDLCLIHRPAATALEMHASYVPHYTMMGVLTRPWARPLLQAVLDAAVRWESALSGRQAAGAVRAESWRQLEEAKRSGLCRHIGVSNYPLTALREMETYAREPPEVLQLEYTPVCQWPEIYAYARARSIALTGYGTGVSKGVLGELLSGVALRLGRTPNQVLLRWRLQRGVGLLQGSRDPGRMAENLGVLDFEIPPAEMALLDGLGVHSFPLYFENSWHDGLDGGPTRGDAVLAGLVAAPLLLLALGARLCLRCLRRGGGAAEKRKAQ